MHEFCMHQHPHENCFWVFSVVAEGKSIFVIFGFNKSYNWKR
jgi:hypothetical protein